MHRTFPTLALLVALAPPWAVPPQTPQSEAHHFADQLVVSSNKISESYVKPIPQHYLAAKALVALHEAANAPLPAILKGDLEKALAGTDLFQEALQMRRALGDVPAIKGENAIRISLQAMVSLLDPYSVYVPESSLELRRPRKAGIGLTLGEGEHAVVRGVNLGGPAAEQGVRPGDLVLDIDGAPTRNERAALLNGKLLGLDGSTITIVVRRGDQPPRSIRFTRRAFREEVVLGVQRVEAGTWDFWLDKDRRLARIRLGNLREGASDELQAVLPALREGGMRGLILDLRDCPGGLLDESTSIVQLFIRSGVVAKIKYRDDEETVSVFRQQSESTVPMIILVSPETSGGGELIAAALQDHKRAVIGGQRSKGKASIQRTPDLGIDGPHSVRITAGYFFRPNGKNLHRHPDSKLADPWGVQPDEELDVRLSTSLRQSLREWRLLHDLRSPDSRQRLPLDDPETDPVLAVARKKLESQVK